MACLLKAQLIGDERWSAFLAACAKARAKLQQTQGSSLMPPEVRVKARYMNLERQMQWAQKRLAYLDGPVDAKLAKRLGMDLEQTRAWLEERLGWLREFREDVKVYAAMMGVLRLAQEQVKKEGMRQDSEQRYEKGLPAELQASERVKEVVESVKGYLKEEGEKWPQAGRYLGTSDLIESLFGKHKQFTEAETHKGMGPNLLLLPLLTVDLTPQRICEALGATSWQDAQKWCAERFTTVEASSSSPPPQTHNQHESQPALTG